MYFAVGPMSDFYPLKYIKAKDIREGVHTHKHATFSTHSIFTYSVDKTQGVDVETFSLTHYTI